MLQATKTLITIATFSMLLVSTVAQAGKLPRLVLSGPPASVSVPLIHMVETGALADLAGELVFQSWRDPDQLRALALGQRVDFVAMPTNVAANLHNRGAELALLNVSTWGVLWMVSRDPAMTTLADFRGKEIAMPFRADMPDLVFALLAEKQGLDPRRDFKLRYVANPLDAMQLLVMRRVDHALLAEPAISMALRKTQSFPVSVIAPELHRSVDLQQEWGRLFAREARIPQAGIVAMGSMLNNEAMLTRVQEAYTHSLKQCQQSPMVCGEMVARHIDLLTPEAVADSLVVSQMVVVPAREAREELLFFFKHLKERNPALLGGKLPEEHFYLQP